MEDLLDWYAEPYDPVRPVICFDESPKQLIGEVREPIPPQSGAPLVRILNTSAIRNLMMICEPKRGWRNVLSCSAAPKSILLTPCGTSLNALPGCRSGVVLDNLNTHKTASLYRSVSPPEEARAIARKLEFHYTPGMAWQHCRA